MRKLKVEATIVIGEPPGLRKMPQLSQSVTSGFLVSLEGKLIPLRLYTLHIRLDNLPFVVLGLGKSHLAV